MTEVRLFVTTATARQSQRLVVGEGETLDAVQGSGRWLATDAPVEVRR